MSMVTGRSRQNLVQELTSTVDCSVFLTFAGLARHALVSRLCSEYSLDELAAMRSAHEWCEMN
jgi:hypothetical protein